MRSFESPFWWKHFTSFTSHSVQLWMRLWEFINNLWVSFHERPLPKRALHAPNQFSPFFRLPASACASDCIFIQASFDFSAVWLRICHGYYPEWTYGSIHTHASHLKVNTNCIQILISLCPMHIGWQVSGKEPFYKFLQWFVFSNKYFHSWILLC